MIAALVRSSIPAWLVLAAIIATVARPAFAADAAGDAVAGQAIFRARCQACHVLDPGQPGKLAPNLRGVVGRAAASTGFAYSPALKASGLTWTPAALDSFLAAPMRKVPGTRMVIAIGDARERADVIAYLATLK